MAEITGLNPDWVTSQGGITVVVSGAGFTGATRVYLRDRNGKEYNAQNYRVDSDTRIALVTPSVGDISGDFYVYVIGGGKKSTALVDANLLLVSRFFPDDEDDIISEELEPK